MKAPDRALIFVHLYNDFSGSPCVLKEAVESIEEEGVERILFTSQHHGALSGLNIKFVTIPYFYSKNSYLKLFFFALSQLILFLYLSICLVWLRLSGKKTKVVVNTILPIAALMSGRLFANRVLSYVHETSVQSKGMSRLLSWAVLRLSHQRLYVSEFVKNHYSDTLGSVVHNGLRKDFAPVNSESALRLLMQQKRSNKRVLFVGNLRQYKGFWAYIELARQCPNVDFNAVINASPEEYRSFKLAYASWPKNLEVVLRPDYLSDYYRKAYLLLNLSDKRVVQETFGMTILEGFAYGCPAIVPSIGGHLEFCSEENSMIADIALLDSVKLKLEQLITDDQYWSELSLSAWQMSQKMTSADYKRRVRPHLLSI